MTNDGVTDNISGNNSVRFRRERRVYMTKRERVMAAIKGSEVDFVPVGMSLHFPAGAEHGNKGVEAHLEFFKQTDTDILKIMNENLVPDVGEIKVPEDWNKIPDISMQDTFMKRQSEMTAAILEKADPAGFTLGTLHGICASAIHPIEARYGYEAVRELQCDHFRENKKPLLEAFKRITDGMCKLAVEYKRLGLDGIYYAGLGGEKKYFTDEEFAEVIEPFDKQILQAAKQEGLAVFLHICKDGLNMERYRGYNNLCDVVNWGVYETNFSLEKGRELFPGTTIMGGLENRGGPMVQASEEELKQAAKQVIVRFGKRSFILGADCTLPTELPYSRVKAVVDAAREI